MRKLVTTVGLAVALLAAPVAANAQGGFIGGLAVGGLIFGGSSTTPQSAGEGTSIIYVMPRYNERIKDALAVRTSAESCALIGADIRTHFRALIRRHYGDGCSSAVNKDWDPDKYEIIQVMRLAHQDGPKLFLYWFAYTEKENLRSLSELPAEKPATR